MQVLFSQPFRTVGIVCSLLGMERLRLREVKEPVQGHAASGGSGFKCKACTPPTASCFSLSDQHGPTEEFHTITDTAMILWSFFLTVLCFVGASSEEEGSFI